MFSNRPCAVLSIVSLAIAVSCGGGTSSSGGGGRGGGGGGGGGTTYGISGVIAEAGGAAEVGVTVSLTGTATATTTTDASGSYSFTGLASGSYTVTPTKSGYTCSPASVSVTVDGANVTGKNFTAAAASTTGHVVSGRVSGMFAVGVTNVTLTLDDGHAPRTTTTDAGGAYAFDAVVDGAYMLTPSKAGFVFTPDFDSVTVNGDDVTLQDFSSYRDPAVLSAGCSITFGPPISATSTCSVVSGAPGDVDPWEFLMTIPAIPAGQSFGGSIDLGWLAAPTMGVAYDFSSDAVDFTQVVIVSTMNPILDSWGGGKGLSPPGTLSITIGSQTDALTDSTGVTSYRPHGQLQATVPSRGGPTATDLTVSATF